MSSTPDTLTGEFTPPTLEADPATAASHDYLFLALRCDVPGRHHIRLPLHGITEIVIGRGVTDKPLVRTFDSGHRLELDLADPRCSKRHLQLQRRDGRWFATDLGSKNGSRIGGARFAEAALGDRDVLEVGCTLLVFRRFSGLPEAIGPRLPSKVLAASHEPDLFRTLSPLLEHQLQLLRRAAPTSLPVLIQGETGTGKEMAAHAIHQLSGRPGPFIAINCGALSATLLETELFGHVRGAFSGAGENRTGLVRAAHQGTLFLDELAEAPPAVQIRLLRVLQEREVLAVGATAPAAVDVRIIAATHGDVHAMARTGSFRSDFLARLTGFHLHLPPLRDRPEDIGLLAAGFLRAALGERFHHLAIDSDAGQALLQYPWPLNIRELERAIGAAVVQIDERVTLAAFHSLLASPPGPPAHRSSPGGGTESLDGPARGSRDHLASLLRAHRGNISAVARALCTSRTQVHRLIARHGLASGGYASD